MLTPFHTAIVLFYALVAWPNLAAAQAAETPAEVQRGAKAFQACVACHALEPGRHLTGPSLAGLFGRKAGTVAGFLRYSDALRRSGVVWDEKTLDAFLADPGRFMPGNEMTFPGVRNEGARRDLIAYLRAADAAPELRRAGLRLPDLKKAGPDSVVKTIRHCGDTYFLTTDAGKLHRIWEFNLRFKTDTAGTGPHPGKPVLIGVGMQGDRAAVVFASPAEFGRFIEQRCE